MNSLLWEMYRFGMNDKCRMKCVLSGYEMWNIIFCMKFILLCTVWMIVIWKNNDECV